MRFNLNNNIELNQYIIIISFDIFDIQIKERMINSQHLIRNTK